MCARFARPREFWLSSSSRCSRAAGRSPRDFAVERVVDHGQPFLPKRRIHVEDAVEVAAVGPAEVDDVGVENGAVLLVEIHPLLDHRLGCSASRTAAGRDSRPARPRRSSAPGALVVRPGVRDSGSMVAAAPPPWYSISGTNIQPMLGVFSQVPSKMFWRARDIWRSRGSDQFTSR